MKNNKTMKEADYCCFFEEKIKRLNKIPSCIIRTKLSSKDKKGLMVSWYKMQKAYIKWSENKSDKSFLFWCIFDGFTD